MKKKKISYSLICALLALASAPHCAFAQKQTAPAEASSSVTYFLSDPDNETPHKMTISIPKSYFMDGIIPDPNSTAPEFLISVLWPSWTGDPANADETSLRILGRIGNSGASDVELARSLLVGVAAERPWKESLDRPFPVDLVSPEKSTAPIPFGHGIKQLIHNKAGKRYDDSDIYVLMISNLPKVIIVCDKPRPEDHLYSPQCQESFIFDHLYLRLGYSRTQINHWFDFMTDVQSKFSNFVVKK
ncbi:hypothetical protein [Swingsia samuiensis]|uniref:Uncharacterized protein n=1 Tax=Swingsia samuiensis TaxID=1293412 RepID=A0A4Y6UHR8_9PROT|nr:hypothetical protein [Swingsia samuiensis]QDH16584.1 hypothetical protein E3D00_02605 [Swingsia samuiensis]